MEEEKIIEFLKISGLNLYESKIYFALLKYGKVSRSEIYKIADIPQSRMYDILVSLSSKGLIKQSDQSVIPEHPRKIINSNSYTKNKDKMGLLKNKLEIQLVDIGRRIDLIQDEKNIFQELEKMYDSPSTQHPIVNRFLSLFKESKKEILCCTTLPILYPSGQFYEEVLKAVDRGISYRRILGFDYIMAQGEKSIVIDEKKGIKIKIIPESNIKEKYYIVDNSYVFLRAIKATLDSENEEAFIFDQKEIIDSYRNSFEKLWKDGETLDSFLKRLKSKIISNKEYASILMDLFENGRANKEALLKKFDTQKSKIQELINNKILKSSEVKDMLIIDVRKLFRI
jgi:sugar-specific transcriptional regulator TrmB